MCGLTGIIFGKKQRSHEDYSLLKNIFTHMFFFSEARGHHASGLSTLDTAGRTKLFKLPVPPSRMIELEDYERVLDNINNKTTLLIGHSRWKTVGTEFNNLNNQPIIAGSILGTHNGTIVNATSLFNRYRLKRMAEVDSEILFRMADASLQEGVLNTVFYKNYLSECSGDLSCVFASKTDPECVYLFKGSKPLDLFYNDSLQVILYSSVGSYITDSLKAVAEDQIDNWVPLKMNKNTMYQTCFSDFKNIVSEPFFFKQGSYVKPRSTSKPRSLDFFQF